MITETITPDDALRVSDHEILSKAHDTMLDGMEHDPEYHKAMNAPDGTLPVYDHEVLDR